MRRPITSALTTAAALAIATPSASAAPKTRHCSNTGYREAISITAHGRTNCAEARIVIRQATRNERRSPKRRTWNVRLPHSTWRCNTIRRIENHGVLSTRWRTTCTLRGRTTPRVRWFNG